jgi:uncharacterized protein YkwD
MQHSAHPMDTRNMTIHRPLAVLATVVLSSCASATEAKPAHVSIEATRTRVVELVNAARVKSRKCGSEHYAAVPPLNPSQSLDEAALNHARDMAQRKFFEHRGSNGSQPKDRVLRAGYQPRLTGENIAFGPESADEAVAGWLASPGHCENIMDPRFKDIGVGVAIGRGRGQIYWVQDFGEPSSRKR